MGKQPLVSVLNLLSHVLLLQAFQSMATGDKRAMAKYNEQQVKQLTRLIEVTRTDLPKVSKTGAADSVWCCETTAAGRLYSQPMVPQLETCCCVPPL